MMNIFDPLISRRHFWRLFLGLVSGLCLVLVIGLPRIPAVAQINQAIVQEILDGDQVFIQDSKAQLQAIASLRDQVRTEESRTALLFNNGAAGRLGSKSTVTVGQCIEVKQGQLVASGPANGCIAGFVAGVQGTIYVMEANEKGEGNIKVLEGTIQLTKQNAPQAEPVELKQGEKVIVFPDMDPAMLLQNIDRISAGDFVDILKGQLFRNFVVPLPGQEKLKEVCEELFPELSSPLSPIKCPDLGSGGIGIPGL